MSGCLTDVAGLAVGHHTDARRPTGCTVVLCGAAGAVGGVDVSGAAPGTRETDLLSPLNTVDRVHAVVLAGGSAFGLDAASGAMRWLDERGIGLAVGPTCVPIVPAAILFDLWFGDASIRPDADAGYAACEAASSQPCARGSVGAGAGATVGKLFGRDRAMKGGIGSASLKVGGITVGALIAVNALGDIVDPATGSVVAGARGDRPGALLHITRALVQGERHPRTPAAGSATTIGVIATDARLTKPQANRLARAGRDGLPRAIDPLTPFDGDTLFALATGATGVDGDPTLIGAMAARVVADAVLDAVRSATGIDGAPSLTEWNGSSGRS